MCHHSGCGWLHAGKKKPATCSCSRYLARVICYNFCLNSWYTRYEFTGWHWMHYLLVLTTWHTLLNKKKKNDLIDLPICFCITNCKLHYKHQISCYTQHGNATLAICKQLNIPLPTLSLSLSLSLAPYCVLDGQQLGKWQHSVMMTQHYT